MKYKIEYVCVACGCVFERIERKFEMKLAECSSCKSDKCVATNTKVKEVK